MRGASRGWAPSSATVIAVHAMYGKNLDGKK
jgi:hypothetical protein